MQLRKEELQHYWWTRTKVEIGGDIPVIPNCNGIIVTNISAVGGAIIFVNGYPLHPPLAAGMNGESWAIGGNFGEVVGEENLEITFQGVGMAFVQMKYYKNIC